MLKLIHLKSHGQVLTVFHKISDRNFSFSFDGQLIKKSLSANSNKYWSSIITSKTSSKIVHFGISNQVLSWRQQQKSVCFDYWDFLQTFWRNNWKSTIDFVERLY